MDANRLGTSFLEQITEELLLYKSVLLSVPEWLPWSDAMCTELEKNLIASGSGRSLEFIDCPEDDIGRFYWKITAKRKSVSNIVLLSVMRIFLPVAVTLR